LENKKSGKNRLKQKIKPSTYKMLGLW